ncbi:MAG: winged helix-turn-helix transcriptional regulator [Candidatus Aminicenantes bacterium]|nr:winged helix-turn-helix transcriptional regulator [Candidatus Aminicenantes bacterium]
MMNLHNIEIYEVHSEFCRAIANPKRLRILNEIGDAKITVGELANLLNLSASNISQHLKILKNYEILKSEKIGHRVYYSITDIRIVEICQSMRQVISDLYEKRMDIFTHDKTE